MSLIQLFRKCNQRCVFCSWPEEGGRGPEADLRGWLKRIAAMPPGLVQISGGEPLLAGAEALALLLGAVRRLGRRAELQTNALAAADLPAADLLKITRALDAAGGYFNVNFPASTAALDYRITGARGGFKKRTLGVRRLIKAGAQVRLTHVVSSLNYKALPAFSAFAARSLKGSAWIQFSFIKGAGRAEEGKFIPKYSDVQPYLERALAACAKNGVPCEVDHIPPCRLGEHWRLNVDLEKMRKGLKGPHLAEKRHVAACRACRWLAVCPGPRKDYLAVHRTI